MCSIAGILSLDECKNINIEKHLKVMNEIQAHRGSDGEGVWIHESSMVGFAHRRLSIIELSKLGQQPMSDERGNWVCFNGEIYNYIELKKEIGGKFITNSDTEVILKAYEKWGKDCVLHFNGMFSLALWDEQEHSLFCARDRFGIKPFYYTIVNNCFLFASEMKALLPFLDKIDTDLEGFKDYLTFQFCLSGKTLFKGIKELEPAHFIRIANGSIVKECYWQVYYNLDWNHTEKYFQEKLEELIYNSIKYHIRSDVPVGSYVSGGIDSSVIASISSDMLGGDFFSGFTGKFSVGKEFDESEYAQVIADTHKFPLYQIDITSNDFLKNIEKVIYYLDTPVAGPGAFCQYMVSGLASQHCKVVLGGQGGDEIFGGYARYLIAYFEQCIKGAIDGTTESGEFIVTYESIIPNLVTLKNYKPMLQEFWKDGLFEDLDKRYFRLINRAPHMLDCIRREFSNDYSPYQSFSKIFTTDNVNINSYFDRMTHFDFKTLLPALLQVEDRMSMAHGVESRVPLLDYKLIEFVATIPSSFKMKDGDMKHIFKKAMREYIPECIQNRKDKMGFPLPLNQWIKNDAKEFVFDIFSSQKAKNRDLIDNSKVLEKVTNESEFGRNVWGMLSLELWQKEFHDKGSYYKNMIKNAI